MTAESYERGTEWVNLDAGYVILRRFDLDATVNDEAPDPIKVKIKVEIRDGRARAREVCVSSDRPLGVGSVTLKSIPVRDMMAHRMRYFLHQIDFDEKGAPIRVPVPDDDEGAPIIVKKLVGYVDAPTVAS